MEIACFALRLNPPTLTSLVIGSAQFSLPQTKLHVTALYVVEKLQMKESAVPLIHRKHSDANDFHFKIATGYGKQLALNIEQRNEKKAQNCSSVASSNYAPSCQHR